MDDTHAAETLDPPASGAANPEASAPDAASPHVPPRGHPDEPVTQLLTRLFGRPPLPRELEVWGARIDRGMQVRRMLALLAGSQNYILGKPNPMAYPPGHDLSPVVNPEAVMPLVTRARELTHADIAGIDFHLDDMVAFWQANAALIAATPFSAFPDGKYRFYYVRGAYDAGDAASLRAMIHAHRPRRVVQITAGIASACIIDCAEEAGLADFRLTCIEPRMKRLYDVLHPGDAARIDTLKQTLADTDRAVFEQLQANDILFVNSSHVLKTGSDVHQILFDIIPRLRPGVLIHFHACRFPFEYSDKLIFERNMSWNEAYALRALLMWNTRLRVVFYNSLFAIEHADLITPVFPAFLENPGGSIWLRVQEDAAPAVVKKSRSRSKASKRSTKSA